MGLDARPWPPPPLGRGMEQGLPQLHVAELLADNAGLRARVKTWTPAEMVQHVAKLREVRAGDPMACPVCAGCFPQILAVEANEVRDNAPVIELVTIPPEGGGEPRRLTGQALNVWSLH